MQFKEHFELLIPTSETEDIRDAVLADLRSTQVDTNGAECTPGSYGYNADSFSLAIVLGALGTLLLSGKSIEENLDAWISLGSRLKKAIRKISQRKLSVRLSEPAAASIAVAAISPRGHNEIEFISSQILPIRNRSLRPELLSVFSQHPDRYYFFVIRINDTAHSVCISSEGRIIRKTPLPLDFTGFSKLNKGEGRPTKRNSRRALKRKSRSTRG